MSRLNYYNYSYLPVSVKNSSPTIMHLKNETSVEVKSFYDIDIIDINLIKNRHIFGFEISIV